jgi:tetratricopeptide (TPR) repeat protein
MKSHCNIDWNRCTKHDSPRSGLVQPSAVGNGCAAPLHTHAQGLRSTRRPSFTMSRPIIILWLCSVGFLAGCANRASDQAARLAAEASHDMVEHRFDDAFHKFEKAAALRPDVAEYHVGSGMAAVKIGELEVATTHYLAAEAILSVQSARDPERVDDHAMVVALLGRGEEAKRILKDGVQRFPDAEMLQKLAGAEVSFLDELRQYSVEPSDPPNDGPATSVQNSDASGGGRHR